MSVERPFYGASSEAFACTLNISISKAEGFFIADALDDMEVQQPVLHKFVLKSSDSVKHPYDYKLGSAVAHTLYLNWDVNPFVKKIPISQRDIAAIEQNKADYHGSRNWVVKKCLIESNMLAHLLRGFVDLDMRDGRCRDFLEGFGDISLPPFSEMERKHFLRNTPWRQMNKGLLRNLLDDLGRPKV